MLDVQHWLSSSINQLVDIFLSVPDAGPFAVVPLAGVVHDVNLAAALEEFLDLTLDLVAHLLFLVPVHGSRIARHGEILPERTRWAQDGARLLQEKVRELNNL
ncbi:hypothetical protein JYP50_15285 [Parahaliea mediterranea]|uniref:Uncharacterized protein n=1 Tax=Parahaliea mediterranea TaxID=651086 RepID=A0A939INE5_9GAMM|nr:hypothetical protein [Parahaliea mediterranea]MBN7797972.1 hypothetical protein [Parahaliea mediterranea]